MDPLSSARQAKHAIFVGRRRGAKLLIKNWDLLLTQRAKRTSYTFSVDRHRDKYGDLPRQYFLNRRSPVVEYAPTPAPQRIVCFWTGDNDLTPGREIALQTMRRLAAVPVELITLKTLGQWIVSGYPLHPRFHQLSLNHRSDYLRAYFMAHHGGGYSDIKVPTSAWLPSWGAFADPEVWMVGYPEVSSRSCGGDDHTGLGRDIHLNFPRLIGAGAFIMRPGTPFAHEWVREIERRLDYNAEELERNPGGIWGDGPGYPLRWIELGSDIFHPLQLKYLAHIRQDTRILPMLEGHR